MTPDCDVVTIAVHGCDWDTVLLAEMTIWHMELGDSIQVRPVEDIMYLDVKNERVLFEMQLDGTWSQIQENLGLVEELSNGTAYPS